MKTRSLTWKAIKTFAEILLVAFGFTAQGQIFVTSPAAGVVGEFTTSGATVNRTLITGLNGPWGMTHDGNGNLYVTQQGSHTVGKYTTSGATVNASLITVQGDPEGVALDGNGHVFVYDALFNRVGEYTTSGATVNAFLVTGFPGGGFGSIACDGDYLYLCNSYTDRIAKYTTSGTLVNATLIYLGFNSGATALGYDGNGHLFVGYAPPGNPYTIGEYTTSGGTVNASLITSGLSAPFGLAISGDRLYVANQRSGTIGEYTTAGGLINSSLVSGVNGPIGLVVVPEPSVSALALLGLALLICRYEFKWNSPPAAAVL